MKIMFNFNPHALQNIKPMLEIINKMFSNGIEAHPLYIVYCIENNTLRLLFDCENSNIVISLSPNLQIQNQ